MFIDNRAVSIAVYISYVNCVHFIRYGRITTIARELLGGMMKKKRVGVYRATHDEACSREDGGKNARTNRDRRGHGPLRRILY